MQSSEASTLIKNLESKKSEVETSCQEMLQTKACDDEEIARARSIIQNLEAELKEVFIFTF